MDKEQSKLFKEGLVEASLSKLRLVAKGDVHNHCGLGMRFTTFNEWAGGQVKEPPKKMDGLKGLNDYIQNETMPYIKGKNDIAFLIEATVKDAIADGVKLLETSIDCHDMAYFDSQAEFCKTITAIRDKYEGQIDFRPEIGLPKSTSSINLDQLLLPCIESGVFKSIDLYGDEAQDDFDRIAAYYQYARQKGLKLKAHAGEFRGHEYVSTVIDKLDPDEIQHGLGAAESEYLQDLIKERGVRINMCPSSNYILGAVKTLKNYPARKFFDRGISVTINSDDLLLFDRGVSQEYLLLYKLGLFGVDELNEIRMNSFRD